MNTLFSRLIQRWPLGVRQQMTLWYTTVLALLIFSSGYIVYKHLEYSLATSLDSSLAQLAQQIGQDVHHEGNTIVIYNPTNTPTSGIEQPGLTTTINGGAIVRILDLHGHIVSASPTFSQLPIPAASITQPLHSTAWQGTVTLHDDLDIRVYSMLLSEQGRPFAILQIGESLAQIRHILHDEALALLLIAPIFILLSALVSSWLASRAFTPIRILTATARRIEAGDLHQRVPIPAAQDEVHFLAVTLNEMIERLEGSFKRQRRFVADASHELRTPVAAIRSKTDLALLSQLTPKQHIAVLQNINTEAERLGHLISDLLALARADEGRAPLEREVVQLDLLLGMVAANAEVLAQERGISLTVQVSEPLTVIGDEARLIQVVMNLLDNALIYTQPGGHVTLSLEMRLTSACIIVKDNGEGIAPEHLSHIFERFYRADQARTRREGGSSGLGLAIVQWVVQAHGGTIEVVSQPAKGSTFTVFLPRTC